MKLLLTSSGLTNVSIVLALEKLVKRPFKDLNAVFIPTAANPEVADKSWLIRDLHNVNKLKFNRLDIVDIAALKADWIQYRLKNADIIFVGGGNCFYLSYWMQRSGLFDLLPMLLETKVYVGISAGTMIVTDNLRVSSTALRKFGQLSDEEYEELGPEGQSSGKTAKFVNFVVRPHLNSSSFKKITPQFLSQVAKESPIRMYAIDDQSAVVIDEGKVEVVSEGEWKQFN